jgi:hypothetical protein
MQQKAFQSVRLELLRANNACRSLPALVPLTRTGQLPSSSKLRFQAHGSKVIGNRSTIWAYGVLRWHSACGRSEGRARIGGLYQIPGCSKCSGFQSQHTSPCSRDPERARQAHILPPTVFGQFPLADPTCQTEAGRCNVVRILNDPTALSPAALSLGKRQRLVELSEGPKSPLSEPTGRLRSPDIYFSDTWILGE